MASATAEVSWLLNLLNELHVQQPKVPQLSCDNIRATYLCLNPVFYFKMKHIMLDYHFVCEKVANGSLHVSHISNHDQLAYILTKPIAKSQFHLFRSKIGVFDGSHILWVNCVAPYRLGMNTCDGS